VYDPAACGRISSIDASYFLQNRGDPRPQQLVPFAVRQAGAIYVAGRTFVDAASWTPVDLTGLREGGLGLYLGSGPPHPGFSSGQLEFGYVTANSCGSGTAPPCVEEQTTAALGARHVRVHR
jgi:hypothetical protein